MAIHRPDLVFNEKTHSYYLDGEKLAGVSSVAKIGEDDIWGVASAWAWRLGYEGAYDLILGPECDDCGFPTKDDLRQGLKEARKTPWHKTKESQNRGIAIHDCLEHLAQKNEVPILDQYPEAYRGYIQALCAWYIDYRPKFVATEVQVVSEKHGFAGRYDVRAIIPTTTHTAYALEAGDNPLCLIDLKTGKKVYPTSQFVQLAGYELASIEMGYPPTDAQYILNVHQDGSYDFARSTAKLGDFLDYLAAYRAIGRIKERAK